MARLDRPPQLHPAGGPLSRLLAALLVLLAGLDLRAQDQEEDGAGKAPAAAPEAGKKADAPPPSLEELKQRFEDEKEKEAFERIPTIELFGRNKSKESVDFLVALYETESNGGIGATVTRALAMIGSEDAAKALVQKGMPYFLEPHVEQGQQAALIKDERKMLLESSMGPALELPFELKAQEWILKNGLSPVVKKDPLATGMVLKAIARFRVKGKGAVLAAEVGKVSVPALQVAILDELRQSPEKDDKIGSTGVALLKSQSPDVQTAAYDLLASFPAGKYRSHLLSGLKAPHWEVKVVCLDGLSAAADKDLVKHATALLKDPDARVRLSAVDALFQRGGPEVIEPLFKALETTDGRVQDDITDALTRLTGKNFGPLSTQWESWWAAAKSTYKKVPPLSPEELAALKAKDSEKITQAIPLYFGLRVLSKRTAFLFDCSESMNQEYKPAAAEGAPAEPSGKTEVVKKPQPGTAKSKREGFLSRLDVAKRELGEVLSKLQAGQSVNIFRFNSLITDFAATTYPPKTDKKVMPRLDPAVREAARNFVLQSKGEGLTNLLSALRQALEYGEVDTIYVLSDGAPTVGVTNHEDLLRELARLNRRRKVKINSISFHPDPAERELLRAIAVKNFGVYVEK